MSIETNETETVITDPETGGRKGQKLARLGSLDPAALLTLAEVSGFGAQKYATFNYLKGYDWSLSFDAMQRHALKHWAGEDLDPESGLPHIAHAAWHALALLSFLQRGVGSDDRPDGGAGVATPCVGDEVSSADGLAALPVGSVVRIPSSDWRGRRVPNGYTGPAGVLWDVSELASYGTYIIEHIGEGE